MMPGLNLSCYLLLVSLTLLVSTILRLLLQD
uniref:Uncharacterized protein n=1 Tax=Rhizophora mucronata TaxID=61149 RepID=A0A2P2NW52_RHIMU